MLISDFEKKSFVYLQWTIKDVNGDIRSLYHYRGKYNVVETRFSGIIKNWEAMPVIFESESEAEARKFIKSR